MIVNSKFVLRFGQAILVAACIVATLACSRGSSKNLPSELSGVESHLTFVTTVPIQGKSATMTTYKVDESFDAFRAELKPQLENGGWAEQAQPVEPDSEDRHVNFLKTSDSNDIGNIDLRDEYTLTEAHVAGEGNNGNINVLLYHSAPPRAQK